MWPQITITNYFAVSNTNLLAYYMQPVIYVTFKAYHVRLMDSKHIKWQ